MSYFEEGDTVPPPFNLIPTTKCLSKYLGYRKGNKGSGSVMVSMGYSDSIYMLLSVTEFLKNSNNLSFQLVKKRINVLGFDYLGIKERRNFYPYIHTEETYVHTIDENWHLYYVSH